MSESKLYRCIEDDKFTNKELLAKFSKREEESITLEFSKRIDRLIEEYNPFFGRKLHEEEEREARFARNMIRKRDTETRRLNCLKYMGSFIPFTLYFCLIWPEIGIRAMYKQVKKLGR